MNEHTNANKHKSEHPLPRSFIRRNWLLVLICIIFAGNALFSTNAAVDPNWILTIDALAWHYLVHYVFIIAAALLYPFVAIYVIGRAIRQNTYPARFGGKITAILLVLFTAFMLVAAAWPRTYFDTAQITRDDGTVEITVSWNALNQRGYTRYENAPETVGYYVIERGEITFSIPPEGLSFGEM